MNLKKLLPVLVALAALAAPAGASAATPGINVAGVPTAQNLQEAIGTGAKTVRFFVLWRDFEPNAKGDYPNATPADLKAAYDLAVTTLNAAGAKPVFVVTEAPQWANGVADHFVPPTNAQDFADFLRKFAAHNKAIGHVGGYEVWNEPDENVYWHPGPDAGRYATLLKATYAAVKSPQGDPSATVLPGPMTGNNYDWLTALYDNGAGGSFDAVSVHTDTACLVDGPDAFYRENGRLARFTFLGYRALKDLMASRGDDGKQLWMTELGWTSTNGSPTSCQRGMWAGKKASGVTEPDQAKHLTKAYSCLANDPYVAEASWFTLRDTKGAGFDELDHYGLLHVDGSPKPALAAFRQVAAANGGAGGPCGDFDAPSIRVVKPAPGTQFVDKLDVQAAASDAGVGIARITFNYDGGQEIRNFTDALADDTPVGLAPWQGSGKLAVGPHTLEVVALDKNGNTSTASIPVVKVTTLASTLMPAVKLKSRKVACKGRTCKVSGSLARGKAGSPSIGGKVAVEWQFRNKQGQWRKLVGGLKPANKPFTFQAKLKLKGLWRVRVVYQGQAPWKKTSSKYLTFRVR